MNRDREFKANGSYSLACRATIHNNSTFSFIHQQSSHYNTNPVNVPVNAAGK